MGSGPNSFGSPLPGDGDAARGDRGDPRLEEGRSVDRGPCAEQKPEECTSGMVAFYITEDWMVDGSVLNFTSQRTGWRLRTISPVQRSLKTGSF